MKSKVSEFIFSVMFAGIILLIIGFYFSAIRGGIPYQDPTIEMQIQWKAYHIAGECNMKAGALLLLCGVVGDIVKRFKSEK